VAPAPPGADTQACMSAMKGFQEALQDQSLAVQGLARAGSDERGLRQLRKSATPQLPGKRPMTSSACLMPWLWPLLLRKKGSRISCVNGELDCQLCCTSGYTTFIDCYHQLRSDRQNKNAPDGLRYLLEPFAYLSSIDKGCRKL